MNHKIILIVFLCSCATYIYGMEISPHEDIIEQQALLAKSINISPRPAKSIRISPHFNSGFDVIEEIVEKDIKKTYCSGYPKIDEDILRHLSKFKPEELTLDCSIIPEGIRTFYELKTLHICCSKKGYEISSLPNLDEIRLLPSLERLTISGGRLRTVPWFIVNLPKLKWLRISFQLIKTIPESINLPKLQRLVLSINSLKQLPESINQLTSLQTLDVSCNFLKKIPDSIGELKNLTDLDVSQNKLETLPPSFGKLYKLTKLNMAFNYFKSLPDMINKFTNLKKLDVSNNRLLPDIISNFPELKKLNFTYNKNWDGSVFVGIQLNSIYE